MVTLSEQPGEHRHRHLLDHRNRAKQREPDGEAKVALKLGAYRKLDPSPLEEFIFFDHPSGRARIQMAMDWKAAHLPCGNLDAPEPATD